MTFEATTKTIKYTDINPNGIYSRTNSAYLGKFTDADFGTFSADFITQINCPEGFTFPETMQSIQSASLGLYYASYYGDSLAPMRVRVDLLDTPIDDDGSDMSLYYTTYDPTKYYNEEAEPLAEKDYTAYDVAVGDSLKSETGYNTVSISLPESFSQDIQKKYEENKDYFKDAYSFIHNVLPGFYVYTGGEFTYSNQKKKVNIKVTIGTADRMLKLNQYASSEADAKRQLQAAIDNKNHSATTISFTTMGNLTYCATQCIDVEGYGKIDGKYYMDSVGHTMNKSGGFVTKVSASRVGG